MSIDRDQIGKWKKEGWKFRKKKVKGNLYITRRLGNQERGLGRYSDEVWRMIENTPIEPSKREQINELKKMAQDLLKEIRAADMSYYCTHIVDGFCNFWRVKEKIGVLQYIDSVIGEGYYKLVESRDGSSFWVFKATGFYCADCPAFSKEDHLLI